MTSRRTVSRLSRILALIPYVLSKDGVQVSEILERFGYNEAQLTRDLNTVFVCGLPGYGPGDLMEAYIDGDEVVIDAADYFARAPRLTSTEALGLMAAGMAIVGSGQGSPELESAVEKLTKAVLPDAGSAISVDVSGESETLASLKAAAGEQSVVRITYRSLSRETETVRDIEPWAVFTTLGNWYVQGFCRLVEGERVFRVDRIRELATLDEHFERPVGIPEPGVGYSPSDDDVVARIRLSPRATWVLDYYPVDVLKETRAGTEIRFSSPDAEIPARLLLRLGAEAKLLDGAEVRARVRSIGKDLVAKYQ
ncbi:MAG TPA: WYL domain-containing protein [Acidimicrobiia bacterium]|nr:WYL domain-containing protein [Acidimicrobiia bacterium]